MVLRAGLVAAIGGAVIADAVPAAVGAPLDQHSVSRSALPGPGSGALTAPVVFRAAATHHQIALTFDDGPDPRWTPLALELLGRYQVPATFFLVGARAQRHPHLVHAEHAAGHQIGNHTWTHIDLVTHHPTTVAHQLRRTHNLLTEQTGQAPTVLRPPWGRIDPVGLLAAAHLNSRVVLWSHLVRGAHAHTDTISTLRTITPGSIVLAHDGGPTPTRDLYQQLDRLILTLQDRGYTFTTLDVLLAAAPGDSDGRVDLAEAPPHATG